MMKRMNRHASLFRALAASIALTAAFSLFPGRGKAAEAESMRAVLLSRDLGDPDNPANAKIAVLMPPALMGAGGEIAAEDFRVYVHPAALNRDAGLSERYLARGVYLWRSGEKVFLDARSLPRQDAECEALARVVYAPGGVVAAETVAEGAGRFISGQVDVVLAVDVSLSMRRNDPRKRRVAAARTFIEMAEQGGGVGRVALVTFNQRAALGLPLIPLSQGAALLDALNSIGSDGLTNLDEPLDVALSELRGSRKPVIILLTDGKNEGHRYQYAHLRAAAAGARIFSVGLSEHADHDLLREMADSTGGIYFRAVTDSDLPGIYARLAAELGKRQLLHAETLGTPNGGMTLPVDRTIRRLVAMMDGGGRVVVADPGTGLFSNRDMTSVHVGEPAPGNWDFFWEDATPGVSTLGSFGDTRFFLDVFPPQLRHDHLAVGATLAEDDRPLTDAKVWIEAVPGLIPQRLHLYDDGEHGDGAANDGVYGATVTLPKTPDRIDLVSRAAGGAWDQGNFVRQAPALALQTGEEPPGDARLGGDVDFGVLFPGETGAAVASVEFEAEAPRDLTMNLSWKNGASEWPDFSSTVSVSPGSHDFELEMTVPEDSLPGDYAGSFTIGNASAAARVRVGDVRFHHGGAVDLGTVPPGTFISRALSVRYEADKPAPLVAEAAGSEDLSVVSPEAVLGGGSGEIAVEAVVSAPMGASEGERSGLLVLRAGPGIAEIPLRWRVRPYAAKAGDITPVPGLPRPPELPSDAAPLQQTQDVSRDFWEPGISGNSPDSLESPWEKAEGLFRESPRSSDGAAPQSAYSIPSIAAPKSGGRSWSAWWVYILAALLLLLLLLLLLAYILYRLGKSALARFLLASAIANVILLAAFIVLLGTEASDAATMPRTISVNLIENDSPETIQLTDAEKELMGAAGRDSLSPSSGGGTESVAGEAALSESDLPSGGAELPREKTPRMPAGEEEDIELAVPREPSGIRLENENRETMSRRERQPERERDSNLPVRDLPEMDEPSLENGEHRGENDVRVDEARLDIDMAGDSEPPVWSEGDRPVQPVTTEQNMLLADASGLETVALEPVVRRVDPRGRRRNMKENPPVEPEQRVEIADPLRDSPEEIPSGGMEHPQGEPGVEEVRVDSPSRGSAYLGEKPGLIVNQGMSNLENSVPSRTPAGIPGTVENEHAAPRGGRVAARGWAGRDDSAMPENGGGLPGTLTGTGNARSGGDRAERAGDGRAAVGERRFDDDPEGGPGGIEGLFGDAGGSRSPSGAASPGGTTPPPLTPTPSRLAGDEDEADGGDAATDSFRSPEAAPELQRSERRLPPRAVSVAASSIDAEGILIVVGDFARARDAASRNLFAELSGSVGKGVTLEERALTPSDINLPDCLLAVLSPEEVRDWSDAAVRQVGDYLKAGGHIWMDAARPAQARPFMDRLARATGGAFAPLDAAHQLSMDEIVDALTVDGRLAAVTTYQDWRQDWRYGRGGDRTMRFLKRTLNYFLSGNADSGISLEPGLVGGGTYIEPYREIIPDRLAGEIGGDGRLWDEFGPGTAASWRMPSWSDKGGISAIADGEGGRALKMDLASPVKGRAAVYRTMSPPQNLAGVDYVTFDAYYDGDGEASLSMVFTVDGGSGWVDYESSPLPLLTGWNRLRFNLGGKTYRSLAEGGGAEQALPPMERTGRAGFFLYRETESPAVVLFRDIRTHER